MASHEPGRTKIDANTIFFKQRFAPDLLDPNRRSIIRICTVHSGKKAANSFGELGPKREVVLNGFKGPELDFGGSKIWTDS